MSSSVFRFMTDFVEPQKQELLELIIRYSPAAIAIFDNELRYITASEKWIRDYGLDESCFKGMSHYEIFPEILDKPLWVQSHLRTLSGKVESSPCDKFERADGSIQYVRWENRPWYDSIGRIGGIVMFTDVITDEVLQSQELERQRRFLRKAQQIAGVGYWRLDLESSDLFWSEEIYAIHGLDPLTYRPRLETAIRAYHPRDREVVEEIVREAIETKQPFDFRLRIVRPDGEIRLVRSQGECELDPQGKVIGIFGVFKDITDDRLPQTPLRASSSFL